MKKRILSILTALCLCLTLLPTAAAEPVHNEQVSLTSGVPKSESGEYSWDNDTLTLEDQIQNGGRGFQVPDGGKIQINPNLKNAMIGDLVCQSGTVTIQSPIAITNTKIGESGPATLKLKNCTVANQNGLSIYAGSTLEIDSSSTLEMEENGSVLELCGSTAGTATITGGGTLNCQGIQTVAADGSSLLLKDLTVTINSINTTDSDTSHTMNLTLNNVRGSIGSVTGNGTVKLDGDVTLTGDLNLTGNVTLDLNGHKLSFAVGKSAVVSSGNTLTVTDSSEDKTGRLTALTVNSGATVNLKGGTVLSLTAEDGATVNLNGGKVGVSDEAELREVLGAGASSIKLLADIDCKTDSSLICKDTVLTLDLNGHVLSIPNNKKLQLEETPTEPNTTVTLIDSAPNAEHSDSTLPKGGVVKGDVLLTRGGNSETATPSDNPVTLHANGGTVTGTVTLCSTAVIDCTNGTPTAFMGPVADKHGVQTTGKIQGGVFYRGIVETARIGTDAKAITFMNGTAAYAIEVVATDKTSVAPITPTKDNYTFAGWYTDETCSTGTEYSFGKAVSTDITLYAGFTPTEYTITYHYGLPEGVAAPANPTTYTIESNDIKLAAPTWENHSFLGWTYEGQAEPVPSVTIPKGSTGSRTYTANWKELYAIHFDPNGGSLAEADTVAYTTEEGTPALAALPTPTRDGYTFDGWYTEKDGGEKVTTDTAFSANTTVYAHWTYVPVYIPAYTVTVADTANGSVSVSPQYATAWTTVTVTVTPDAGYTLETLTVTDSSGNEIRLTDRGDGRYTFTMPAGKVTVAATFMDDNTMLNFFVDVTADKYYYDAVLWAARNGITTGVDENHFGPDQSCTRAELVTFLYRYAQAQGKGFTGAWMFRLPFSDVSAWCYESVAWSYMNGIVQGYGNGLFGSGDNITREQFVTILYRFAQFMGMDVSVGADTNILSYNDAFEISEYAVEAMQWAAGAGILQGYDGNLMPKADCSRAQIVTMLYRLLGE